ncbi:MAG: hypothetical protein R3313_02280 [Candidatus Saccharimonadales bacterium]|nr:hypothetical protein [Candidatus Saccharimonadales bacterium]
MKNIGVIFGSRSAEHDISVVTAIGAVINPLKLSNELQTVPIYISKDGSWYSEPELGTIEFYTSGHVEEKLKKFKKVQLLFDGGLYLIKAGLGSKKTRIDVAFPATHGTYGEDGSLMGLLRMADVPFVGSDMTASAISMDKVFTKDIALAAGCPTPKYVWFTKEDFSENKKAQLDRMNKLKYPVFVKPSHLGSSIGLTQVKKESELENAIEVALHYDDKVLVEEAVHNMIEVTLPIMGNQELTPALLEQPILKKGKEFDFTSKYLQGGGKKGGKMVGKMSANMEGEASSQGYSKIPAEVPKDLYDQSVEVALKAFKAVGCEGFARVDLMIDSKAKKVFFIEINPLPGQLYNHNWRKAGISPLELVEKLIGLAEERYQREKQFTTTFDSNFLSQF